MRFSGGNVTMGRSRKLDPDLMKVQSYLDKKSFNDPTLDVIGFLPKLNLKLNA
jgi:hypothetical protein